MLKKYIKRRWLRGLIYTVAGLGLLLPILVYLFAPYAVLTPRKWTGKDNPATRGLKYEKINVRGYEGVNLSGYYLPAEQAIGTVLFIHGIHACKEYFFWSDLPKLLVENRLNVVAFDNRGHGESDDAYISYGYKEREDIKCIVSYLDSLNGQQPLAVWGHSLGASIALNALAVDKRIDLGVVESGYSNLPDAVNLYQGHWFGLRWRWLSDWILAQAADIGGFEVEQINPSTVAQQVQQPVWVGHGAADHRIPVEHSNLIFNNLASKTKEHHVIPNVRHSNVWARANPEYQLGVIKFILNNLR